MSEPRCPHGKLWECRICRKLGRNQVNIEERVARDIIILLKSQGVVNACKEVALENVRKDCIHTLENTSAEYVNYPKRSSLPVPERDALDKMVTAMSQKMLDKHLEGRSGFEDASVEHLNNLLHEHIPKGDPVDIANFCAFLHYNGHKVHSNNALVQLQEQYDTLLRALYQAVNAARRARSWVETVLQMNIIGSPAVKREGSDVFATLTGVIAEIESNVSSTPFQCRFKICDLPGQCKIEGKCHHPISKDDSSLLFLALYLFFKNSGVFSKFDGLQDKLMARLYERIKGELDA
jgi:hypothetical protein